jgi:large subunit ribosomal protein L28
MAKTCPVTNRTSLVAGGYSNATRATQYNPTGKVRKQLNLQKKKIYIPELKKSMIVKISTRGWKTMEKNGAYVTLKKAGLIK